MTRLRRSPSGRVGEILLAIAAAVAGAGVLGILVFLAVLSAPVLTGAAEVWTWTWKPFQGHHGILPMVLGSLLLSVLALLLAFPAALLVAAFVHAIGPRPLARLVLGGVRFLTGVPTIVYAFVSAMVLVPFVRRALGHGSGFSLLSASLVLAVLVLPTMVLLLHAHWAAMGSALRVTCAALGLDRVQETLGVLFRVSRRGMVVAGVLGFARALGDTMIALLLSGNAAQVPSGPLDSIRALSAHVALVHSTDTQDPGYVSIFAAGLLLLLTTAAASLGARALGGGLSRGGSLASGA